MRQIIIFSVLMVVAVYLHIFFFSILGIDWVILPLWLLAVHAFLSRRGRTVGAIVGGLAYDVLVPGTFGIVTGALAGAALLHGRLARFPVTEEHPLLAFGHGSLGVLMFFILLGLGRAAITLFTAGNAFRVVSQFPYGTVVAVALTHGVLVVSFSILRELILRPRKSLVLP